MNNEINKSHEEILEKHHRDNIFRPPGNFIFREDALKAMAEVAGLRDKEVEELKVELTGIKEQRQNDMLLAKQAVDLLAAKDKEIDILKFQLATEIEPQMLKAKDERIAAYKKEIEQLKAALRPLPNINGNARFED